MRALVLLYNGHEVSNEVLAHIIDDCVTIGMISDASTCQVHQLSENDIIKTIAASVNSKNPDDTRADEMRAIDNALFIITTAFGNAVKQPDVFKMQLFGTCLAFQHNRDVCPKESEGVYQAVKTLGSLTTIPKAFLDKYNTDINLLNIIKQVKESCYV